ncbi:MAG: DNA internalization-related competence protein ComEC/Rec2 [Nitrospinae bacterium]|nr:DNA internalization-related competence protein ComEC/Rec2 [Nitrospinota bacterium]
MNGDSPDTSIEHPALLASFSFAAGIAFGRFYDCDPAILGAVALGFAAALWRADIGLRVIMALALAGGAAVISGHGFKEIRSNHVSRMDIEGDVAATVEVKFTDSVRPHNTRYIVEVKSIGGAQASGAARLVMRRGTGYSSFEPSPGDILLLENVKFRQPRGFRNIGAFDYEAYMKERDIHGDFFTGKKTNITLTGTTFNWMRPVEAVKERMRRNLDMGKREATAITWAILLGDDGMITPEQRSDFSRAGTAHILSVSGLHVGFVAMACFFAAKLMFFAMAYPVRYHWASAGIPMRGAAFVALMMAVFYAALTGMKFPIIRSAIMIGVYLAAVMAGRGRDFYGSFGVALFIILLMWPWALFDAGFQLSFTAVFAIVIFMERWWKPMFFLTPLEEIAPTWRQTIVRKAPWLFSYIAVSVFATIGTAPIVAYHFNNAPVYGFLVNAIVVPISSFAIPWGMLWAMGGHGLATDLTGWMMGLIGTLSAWAAGLPMSYKAVTAFHPAALAFYYLSIGALLLMKRGAARWIAAGGAAVVALVIFLVPPRSAGDGGELVARFVDIGQGDCTMVLWPQKGAMVIDGGPKFETFDPGRSLVAPLLFREGRSGITAMIATHEDSDHLGGLAGLASLAAPEMFMDNGAQSEAMEKLRGSIKAPGGHRRLYAGDTLEFPGGLKARVLNPPNGEAPYKEAVNNASLAIMLEYGEVRVLTLGDIGKEAEQWLVSSGADIRADVIKIAHHGSASSSLPEFLKAVGARTAIISAGYRNNHHHPSAKALERIKAAGMRVFRTDMDGEVRVITDGKKVRILTWGMERYKEGGE